MALRDQLDHLIEEMVEKGIRYQDAYREFERRFIIQVLTRHDGCLQDTAEAMGMHRNTLSRKIAEHRIKKP
ncbi:MAG TPA: helix-turn-helix domain-containing protein [Vicinamibacterales bacterium]|jgi:DNA-binding NtrC family response regulator